MTKKVKFVWEFKCNEKDRYLEISLNGGTNKSLWFDHPDYYKFLNQTLTEIMFYEHIVGNKTIIYGLDELSVVNDIRKDEPIEIIKQQQLASKGR